MEASSKASIRGCHSDTQAVEDKGTFHTSPYGLQALCLAHLAIQLQPKHLPELQLAQHLSYRSTSKHKARLALNAAIFCPRQWPGAETCWGNAGHTKQRSSNLKLVNPKLCLACFQALGETGQFCCYRNQRGCL